MNAAARLLNYLASVYLASAGIGLGLMVSLGACGNTAKLSADRAVEHVGFLAPVVTQDVREVREGLPEGAKYLSPLWKGGIDAAKDPEAGRDALERARGRVQNLRVAKSSFFALADKQGTVIRSDQPQDWLAGKNVFSAFPGLQVAAQGTYAETLGSMHEARGVEGKPDAQWVAAVPVKAGADATETAGVYVTGWAWSHYARRLEEALKSHLGDTEKDAKKPLFYVFIVVGDQVFGSRPAPVVNAQAIAERKPAEHIGENGLFRAELEITERWFGLAVKPAPELGPKVLIAVLRSET
jgi:hypothetical protein